MVEQTSNRTDSSGQPPASPLEEAIAEHQQGNLEIAESKYREVLEQNSQQPDALHLLGVLRHQRGDRENAERMIRDSIGLDPSHSRAHNNLGNVLSELERFDEAEACYLKALELQPDYATARLNLGHVLLKQSRLPAAQSAYEAASSLDPENPEPLLAVADLRQGAGALQEAITLYERVLELDDDHLVAYHGLAATLRKLNRLEEARAVYDKLLERLPYDSVARHLRAACDPENVPDRASDDYIRTTFDGFAGSFDERLEELEYRAPELLVAALTRHRNRLPDSPLQILDAGCGTGLLAARGLGGNGNRLIGVDLSEKMLEHARTRGGYDELVAAELGSYLESRKDAFEVIASADTLIYFGDLEPVLRACRLALRPGGLLAFSTELADADDATLQGGFRLNRFGRYEHDAGYVRDVLAATGLELLELETPVLRREGGAPVTGLVAIASA